MYEYHQIFVRGESIAHEMYSGQEWLYFGTYRDFDASNVAFNLRAVFGVSTRVTHGDDLVEEKSN